MVNVRFTDWKYGLQKVSLTKLFRNEANLPLDVAKGKTDRLIDGKSFDVEFETVEQAELFVEKVKALGAICRIVIKDD
jgi:hypothetical protein